MCACAYVEKYNASNMKHLSPDLVFLRSRLKIKESEYEGRDDIACRFINEVRRLVSSSSISDGKEENGLGEESV